MEQNDKLIKNDNDRDNSNKEPADARMNRLKSMEEMQYTV